MDMYGYGGGTASGGSVGAAMPPTPQYNPYGDGAPDSGMVGQAPNSPAGQNAVGYGIQSAAKTGFNAMIGNPIGVATGVKGIYDAARASEALSKGKITQQKMTSQKRQSLLGEDGDEGLGGTDTDNNDPGDNDSGGIGGR